MTNFKYTAVTSDGNRINGQKQAASKDDIVSFLNNNGMTIVMIEEDIGLSFNKLLKINIGGLSITEKVLIVKQLSTMISAGIPLIQAIDILVQQAEKESTKEKIQNIYKSIESGISLSEAFEKEEGIFSEVQINLIAAGEKSGNLNEMLGKVAEDMDKSKNLRGKIVGAMIYPVIIFVVMIAVLIIMITFMVPQLEQLYESLGQTELPLVTRILVSIGGIFTNTLGIIFVPIFLLSSILGYKYFVSTKGGRRAVDKFKLKIPIFGNLITKIELVEFTRILSMLLKSGIPIIDAVDIVSRAMGNVLFVNTVYNSKQGLIKGDALSIALVKNNKDGVFPLILLKILSTGEEAGKLDKVLDDMSKYYEAEVEQITSNLTKLMEPLILVIAGVMVAFLAIAIYFPLYQIMQSVQ